jgi:hypothetical protein
MKLKTDKAVMEALLRGEKVRHAHWDSGSFCYLDIDGRLRGDDGGIERAPNPVYATVETYTPPPEPLTDREALRELVVILKDYFQQERDVYYANLTYELLKDLTGGKSDV